MLKIAICDDTREERELVEQYAKRYFDARKQPAEFEIFHSMQDVLDTGRAYDLYLLDVLMPGKSGIQGAADRGGGCPSKEGGAASGGVHHLLPGIRGRQLPCLRLRISVKARALGGL